MSSVSPFISPGLFIKLLDIRKNSFAYNTINQDFKLVEVNRVRALGTLLFISIQA